MISALQTGSKPRGNRTGTPGRRLRRAREEAGYETIVAGAEALQDAGIDVGHQALGHYERDRTAPQIDIFLQICDVFDASPLYVLIGLGPRHWTELGEYAGVVAERAAPYGIANRAAALEVHVAVAPEERRALHLIAQVKETSVPQLVRELLDLPRVIEEEQRIRQAVERYEASTRERK